MIFISFLIAVAVAVDLPRPVVGQWAKGTLSLSWPAYSAAVSYTLSYNISGILTQLSPSTQTSTSIPCSLGSLVHVTYKVTLSTPTSPSAPLNTFLCITTYPISAQFSLNLQNLTLSWSTPDPYILGCYASMGTFSQFLPGSLRYLSLLSSGGVYQISCYNFEGFSSVDLEVPSNPQPNFAMSEVSVPESIGSQTNVTITAKILDVNGVSSVMVLAVLEIRDVCYISNGYECIRAATTDAYYVKSLIQSTQYVSMNGIGILSGTFLFEYPGYYTLSVIVLQAGVLAQYWDNIWFDGNFETKIHSNLNITYTGYITLFTSTYISAKFFMFISTKYTEYYTLTIVANDSFRLYVNGNLLIDNWAVVARQKSGAIYMVAGQLYSLKVDYKHLQGPAGIAMYWSSRSQPKQIIPAESFYWPTRLPGSPWVQTVISGQSKASLCYFNVSSVIKAGYLTNIDFYSVDASGALLNRPSDIFTVEFTDSISYTSSYVSNAHSVLIFSLTVAKTYTVYLTLYGINIKNSPFTLTVIGGDISSLFSTVNLISETIYSVGVFNSITCNPYDAFGNSLSSCTGLEMDFTLILTTLSNLEVSPPVNWLTTYNKPAVVISGLTINFKLYISGSYSVSFKISSMILPSTYLLTFTPSSFMPEHLIGIFSTPTLIAGESFTATFQSRDSFYNNITESVQLTSSSFISLSENIGEISEDQGIITATIILTHAGVNLLQLIINSVKIPLPEVIVEASAILSSSYSVLTVLTPVVKSGAQAAALILSKDVFGNLRYNPGDEYAIDVTSATPDIIDNQNGTYSILFVPLVIGQYIISVYASSVEIQGSPATVVVGQSAARGFTSELSGMMTQTAGEGVFTIITRDMGSNLIADPVGSSLIGLQYYTVSFFGPETLIKNASYQEYSQYSVYFPEIVKTGKYMAVLTLVESGGLIGDYYSDGNFVNHYSTLSTNSYPPGFYTAKDEKLEFDWTAGNPVFGSSRAPDGFSVVWTGRLYVFYSETYTFTLTCDNLARLTVDSRIIIDSISTRIKSKSLSGSIILEKESFYNIKIEYQNGGPGGHLSLRYSSASEPLKLIPSEHLFAPINSSTSPHTFTVTPAKTNPYSALLSTADSNILTIARSGTEKIFKIQTLDIYNNFQTASDLLSAAFTNTDELIDISGTGGTYTGRFTLSAMGYYKLQLYYHYYDSGVIVLSRSFMVSVIPGPASPLKSVFLEIHNPDAASLSKFIIQLYDASDNAIYSGGDHVGIAIDNDISSVPSAQITIADNENGKYTCRFTSFIAGTFTITSFINTIKGSQSSVTVYPLSASALSSTVSLPMNISLNQLLNITININDIYSNSVNTSYSVFSFITMLGNKNFKTHKFILSSTTPDVYEGSFNFSLANIDRSGACTKVSKDGNCSFTGDLTVFSGIFDQGVHAKYFDNNLFIEPPTVDIIEENIEHNWMNSAQGINVNNFSVYWEGFIEGDADAIKLSVNGTQEASIYVDFIKVLSMPAMNKTSIMPNLYYYVQVYYNTTNSSQASVEVMWNDPPVVIPKTSWFWYLDKNLISGKYVNISSV